MDLHYKIHADSDQVAKFQGDRSRELGERVAKKKKNITGKTEDLPLLRTGGLNSHQRVVENRLGLRGPTKKT